MFPDAASEFRAAVRHARRPPPASRRAVRRRMAPTGNVRRRWQRGPALAAGGREGLLTIELDSIAALFGTMLVLAVVPGPTDFAVVARSIACGFAHGFVMVAGIVAADLLFIVFAVYSMTVTAQLMGGLFVIVKYLCGAYLVFMGIGLLRSKPAVTGVRGAIRNSRSSSFLSGLFITLGDPKAILFYMGLFPAFLDLSGVTLTDTVIIMLVATVVVGGVKLSYVFAADKAMSFLDNPAARRVLNVAAGCMLCGTGIYLLARS